ncbi:NADP-reducing hydrogenase subunit HndA [Koleobacter methoxysyntrophicus]|jgi:NADH-quinone oxidoreductase E subunit|uniref:NADP-reducing hydrogenase subunit HndA n=1 Tax=Koleobacter methoxysyntrophicus TaxID=2751313 RepID=A0A8A0RQ27_9FIRM|nr:NAD(P)H-dependent oxidoreductase subunit E [Koleobacter methoxysyntrophicus]NPV43182.1 NAD(P)H-dependent oxidoreductase subunit E [Bacillota bacterium]QSQ09507.1 NADP-reducing hydrogenase subunit HndA [Koleobacter methoxysyntrophicus]
MSETYGFKEIGEQEYKKVDEIIDKFSGEKGALIPILREIQDYIGYLPREIQVRVAEKLDIPLSEVYSIVTFYALFSLKPKGKYQINLCKGTACYVRGADRILEKVRDVLGIGPGDTTDDGLFSLDVIRCLGACGLGPVITINDETYARLKPDNIPEIIARYKDIGSKDFTVQPEKEVAKSR